MRDQILTDFHKRHCVYIEQDTTELQDRIIIENSEKSLLNVNEPKTTISTDIFEKNKAEED